MTMHQYKWMEKFVCDAESAIALFTMGFPQQDTVLVWVDTHLKDVDDTPIYRLVRRVDCSLTSAEGVFAAYTAQEFQTIMPINFMPMQVRPGLWIIVDAYGTKLHDEKGNNAIARQVIMSRVNGSDAERPAEAFARAAIFLIQTGNLKFN